MRFGKILKFCHFATKRKMRKKSKLSDRAEMLIQGQIDAAKLTFVISCWEFITVQEKSAFISFYLRAQNIFVNFENL